MPSDGPATAKGRSPPLRCTEGMKRLALLSAWFALASYCALSLAYGTSGVVAERALKSDISAMNENLRALEGMNRSFSAEWAALDDDPEAIALEARAIGYVAPDEVVVRLSLKPESPRPSCGEIVRLAENPGMPDAGVKRLALILGCCAFAGGIALRALSRGRFGH